MDTIEVCIGSVTASSGGLSLDTTKAVTFQAEQIASYTEPGTDRSGTVSDTRGIDEVLYRLEDGRLVVYRISWSHWQGEPNVYSLFLATSEDLGPMGRFAMLGAQTEFGRALSIDEALGGGLAPEPVGAFLAGDLLDIGIVTDPATLEELVSDELAA